MLELSMSLLLDPDYVGFYIGTIHIAADPAREVEQARSFMVKLWFVMFQITMYG